MVDTETCGELESPFVYDCGIAIVDRKGKVYAKYSFVVGEVFYGMADLMKSVYYSEKLPQYHKDIAVGKRKVISWCYLENIFTALISKWNITAVVAHNARFDVNALNHTATYFNNGIKKYVFPYDMPIWCTLTMARQIFWNKPTYKDFCDKYSLYTPARHQMSLTAENLYRFITRDYDFKESHTGLEDVMIEKEILIYMLRQKKKIRKTYYKERAV